ncbi:MAG: hypothetical protein U9N03_00395 [Candidatus Caldatribacteriota bacterium]|nr:hypothetical protein [Candidatus Caldatribacteriota bacterium]
MTKKERLGSDPFKDSSLNWIQDTREEKKDSKEIKKQKPEKAKPKSVKTLKRYDAKELKRQSVMTSKRQNAKTSKSFSVKASKTKQEETKSSGPKRKHTIYLSSKQSKKLKVYAAKNDMKLSKIIEKLISDNI